MISLLYLNNAYKFYLKLNEINWQIENILIISFIISIKSLDQIKLLYRI